MDKGVKKPNQNSNGKEMPGFIIDCSVLKDMFEGKNKGKADDFLKKFKDMSDRGIPIKAVTTQSSFLRAIFLCDSKAEIGKVQKVLSFLKVYPSFADFKKEEEVRNEIIMFARMLTGEKYERKN